MAPGKPSICLLIRLSELSARAHVEKDGRSWVATLDAGGVTQARRLDQLPERLAEVHELMTGESIDPDDIALEVDFPAPRQPLRSEPIVLG